MSPPTWLPFVHTSAHRIRSLLILTYKDAHGRLRSAFKTVVEVSNVIHGVKRKKKLKTVGGRSLKNVITRILWGGEKKKSILAKSSAGDGLSQGGRAGKELCQE